MVPMPTAHEVCRSDQLGAPYGFERCRMVLVRYLWGWPLVLEALWPLSQPPGKTG